MRFYSTATAGLATAALLIATAPVLAQQTMNMGFTLAIDSHYGAGAKAFAQKIEELSDGKFEVVPKPSGALGGERDVVEGLQIGSIPLTISSTGPLGNFVPDVYVLDFPFLFDSYEHARSVLDGPIGQELLQKFEDKGLIGLAWTENGFRHLTNNARSVEGPKDMDGLKIRTMENKVHMAAFEAMDANPTPMSFTELFTALQQGTVDGEENPIPVIITSRFYEVQDYLTLTGHVYSPAAILMSKIVWDGLSDEEKDWFRQAAKASAQATRQTVTDLENEGVKFLQEQGMEVVRQIDGEAFREAVQPVYDQYARYYGPELIERIRAAASGGSGEAAAAQQGEAEAQSGSGNEAADESGAKKN